MAPAQASIVVEQEKKSELAVKDEPKDANEDSFGGLTKVDECLEDVEVDVLESVDGDDLELFQGEDLDPDATEHSSSFGDTLSGSDNELCSSSGDMEVDSGMRAMEQQTLSNGFQRLFRKKKLSDHWRNFIRPLTWRCEWIELRMSELYSQAQKYDKELVKYLHKKQLRSTMVELDGSVSRAVPLACLNCQKQAMKRRRRKRNEDTVDISSYMSHHNLFSYYENKRSDMNCYSIADDCGDPVDQKNISRDAFETLNEWLMLGGKDTTQEQILLNIEAVHARIRKVKVRLEDLMKANNQELPLSQEFVGPGNLSNSVARSLYSSPGHNEDALLHETPHTPKNHVPEYESDVVWPGSTVSSYGDDIVENTMDLFSAAHSDQHFVDSCKDSIDEVLIHNQAAEEDQQNFDVGNAKEQSPEQVKERSRVFLIPGRECKPSSFW
ncbi:uncharacterized protein LOC120270523 [Dioscorea cayenensis subsp. rotundata]|uniref:Uncharacterized protein LOC120270523 n=1 Tax=Dioscorea cayennensis subsp. rotundata TaxID=55577 RepID=A0AB40C159_DIOCR|nr:uncharacterized protein LOC120270523 [Dioscorea cayenensis subsp. rotundata]